MEQVKRSTESPNRLPLLLGLAVALGGVLLWDQWSDWSAKTAPRPGGSAPKAIAADQADAGVAASPSVGADQAAHPLASLALDQLHDTVGRPLFERTRRPLEPPQTRAAPAPALPAPIPRPAADPNALTLLGVLINDGGHAIALLQRNSTGQSVRLQEGDTVDGWTIERIEAEEVVLKQGDTNIALQLFRKRW